MSINMTLIETKTVGAGGVPSVTFSSIPTTYTDLKIVASARQGSSGTEMRLTFNGSSTSYTNRRIFGTGSGSLSADSTGTTYVSNTMANDATFTASTFGNGEWYIPSYRSANNKAVSVDGVTENNATTALSMLTASLWSNTDQITSITITAQIPNFVEGSTFSLYGISAVTSTPKATGGMVSQDNSFWYHTFATSGVFTATETISADILCIAGGGGTGLNFSAGAGAGGLLAFTSQSLTATNYAVSVGAGGAGSGSGAGTNGGNSQFASLTAAVGGGTGMYGGSGNAGGSSGGSGGGATSQVGTGFGGTTGQGNAGGGGWTGNPNGGSGGGGGAGGAGVAGTFSKSGNGGIGVNTYASWANATFTGVNGYYAGGGGGGSFSGNQGLTFGEGGLGGGGRGGNDSSITLPTAGLVNTGGGGGGAGANSQAGVNGGSGLIIVRYAK